MDAQTVYTTISINDTFLSLQRTLLPHENAICWLWWVLKCYFRFMSSLWELPQSMRVNLIQIFTVICEVHGGDCRVKEFFSIQLCLLSKHSSKTPDLTEGFNSNLDVSFAGYRIQDTG
jgi:hypothetical protein